MGDIIFSVSADTANGELSESILSNEIIASGIVVPATGLLNLIKIERLDDVMTITHTPTLNPSDSGVLVDVVAAHSGAPLGDILPGPTGNPIDDAIDEHAADPSAHHVRYTDAEAIAASSGALDHHLRYTDAEASGVAVQVTTTGILEHTNISSAHHARYTDAEAIAASSGALDHHVRYADAEASGIAVQVTTTGILEHTNISDAHHTRYTDTEAIAASSGALDHHLRYTDTEASGVAVDVVTTGILEHTNISEAHHTRYTDTEAIAASSGALDHHVRYTDAEAIAASSGALDHHDRYTNEEASGVAVQVTTTGILEHSNISDAHHVRYTDAEAIAASSGALDHHVRYTDAEASGVAVQVTTTGILEHTNISSAHHARYTDAEASGVAVLVVTTGILEHANISSAHHARYTDAEAIDAASGALDHHVRYTDAEVSGVVGTLSIDELADVDTTTLPPVLEDSLVWDGTIWAPSGVSSTAGGVGFTSFKYRYRTDIADADPGNGRIRLNNINLQIATESYIDAVDSDGTVLTNILNIPVSGDILVIQELTDASKWWAYDLNASGVAVGDVNTGYTRFTDLSIRASGLATTLNNNTDVILGFIFIANRGDTGGGGGASGPVAHTGLTDMPSAVNTDHDGRYYTQAEIDAGYLKLDTSNDPLTNDLVVGTGLADDSLVRFYSEETIKYQVGWNESEATFVISESGIGTTDIFRADSSSIIINPEQLARDFILGGNLAATPDLIQATSAGVAASLATLNTEVTTNDDNDLDNVTLASGISGQMKNIYCVASNAGDTWKITPANMLGGTQITFGDNSVGAGCSLVFADGKGWAITGNNGGTIS